MNFLKMHLMIGLVLYAALSQPASAGEQAETTRVAVGEKAPEFECTTLEGDAFELSEQEGKVVVINFFATWCGPCRRELPHLQKRIYQVHGKRDDFRLLVIGREHEADELKEYLKSTGLELPMAPDPERTIYGKYADKFIPRNFVIGKDGAVKLASTGFSEEKFAALVETVASELAK